MRRRDYDIVFASLKHGTHTFECEIDDSFLNILFDYRELDGLKAHVALEMVKRETLLELSFILTGIAPFLCDLTNEPFEHKLGNQFTQVVKFGAEYNDDDDEILILPHGTYEINVAQQIYELIVLAVPNKRIHPDVASGKAHPEILDLLDKYTPDGTGPESESNEDVEEDVDPRWSKLKDLLN